MNKEHLNAKDPYSRVILLTAENLDACVALDQITLNGFWNKPQWDKELSDQNRLCIGIFEGNDLIAFACGWLVFEEIHITAIGVHPGKRRKGLGKNILKALLHKASINGINYATLEVDNKNEGALALYKSCGFKVSGLRKNYYRNRNDALIEWKSLNQIRIEADETS